MNRGLKILNFASGMYLFAIGLFAPLYALFVDKIGGGAVTAGASYSIFAIAAGILIFVVGRIEDSVDHQELLVSIGYLLASLGYFAYMFVETVLHLFLVQAMLGIAVAVRSPAFDSLYSQNLQAGRYASEWGTWEALSWIATGVSALVGGFVVTRWSFDTLFAVMTVIAFAGFIGSLLLLKRK